MDLRNKRMNNLAAMKHERSGHASVFFGGCVFVAGGQTKSKKDTIIHDTVEKYGN